MDGTYLSIAEEVLQIIYDKQFYNQQFLQFEYDQLVNTANSDITDKEWQPGISRAQDLLDTEKSLDNRRCPERMSNEYT